MTIKRHDPDIAVVESGLDGLNGIERAQQQAAPKSAAPCTRRPGTHERTS